MALELTDGGQNVNPLPWFRRYYNLAGNLYTDVAEAKTEISAAIRFPGMTIGVDDGSGNAVEYWWRDGTADGDLILKVDLSNYMNLTGTQSIGGNKTFTGQTAASRKSIPVSASRPLALTDLGCRLVVDSTAGDITITIPKQATVAWLTDSEIEIHKKVAGNKVLIVRDADVALASNLYDDDDLEISDKRTTCLLKREDENLWVGEGSIG